MPGEGVQQSLYLVLEHQKPLQDPLQCQAVLVLALPQEVRPDDDRYQTHDGRTQGATLFTTQTAMVHIQIF